ncbi:hypothetical protein C3747_604g3 [Trypanosoma cruzi]|uniref:Uncharacterized protein n=1 Tax=Trypanosoma cruzi TaxID=5693 RepID=A0A2V2UQY9_TRYCR|nr:hypothetical protein C3747_604g3 [Trypanosoma cruzi]
MCTGYLLCGTTAARNGTSARTDFTGTNACHMNCPMSPGIPSPACTWPVLRYQLNPYRPPHLPPPLGFEDCIYRNQRPSLREVFMELVPLRPGVDVNDALSLGAAHGACGVQLYTEATGVFEEFPRNEENGLALIYSTVPWAREELQTTFDAGAEAPSLWMMCSAGLRLAY